MPREIQNVEIVPKITKMAHVQALNSTSIKQKGGPGKPGKTGSYEVKQVDVVSKMTYTCTQGKTKRISLFLTILFFFTGMKATKT